MNAYFGTTSCLLVGLILSGLCSTSMSAADRPNIVWISTEDTTREYGCYGDEYALTPNIDALAKRGIRFTNCYAEAPMCSPSRFALITGLHPGPMGTSPMRSTHRIPDYVKGFPTYLRNAGYYTSNNVKTDYNTAAEPRLVEESWDECSASAHWRKRKPGQPFFAVFNYMDTHQSRDSQWPYEDFSRKIQVRLKAEQIHDPAKAPLPPYYPDTMISRRTIARYHDCISTLDGFLQKRLDELKEDGVADDTIVVFFADNGAGIPRAKAASFEIGVREPLIVCVPGKYRHLAKPGPGSTVDELVHFVDFAPTMLSLAGLELPAYLHGRAFLGPRASAAPEFVVGIRDRLDETLEVTRWLSDGRFHYIHSFSTGVAFDQQTLTSFYNSGADATPPKQGGGWHRVKDGGELVREIRALKTAGKLNALQQQYWGDSRPLEALYDGEADPWNLKNLADAPEYQERLRKMRGQLHAWMVEHRDLGLWPEPEQTEAEKEGAACEMAKKEGVYPIERVLATADLAGRGAGALPELRQRLKDENSAVRYWAAVGLHALRDLGRPALEDFKAAMADPAASVRIEAAWAVVDLDNSADALALLARELENPNGWAAFRAARAMETLGEKARPQLAALKKAFQRAKQVNHSFEFSLLTVMETLGEKE